MSGYDRRGNCKTVCPSIYLSFYPAVWRTRGSYTCISKVSVKDRVYLNLTQHLVFVRKPQLQMICQLTFTANELISVLLPLNTRQVQLLSVTFAPENKIGEEDLTFASVRYLHIWVQNLGHSGLIFQQGDPIILKLVIR